VQELALPATLVGGPELESAGRHVCVGLVRTIGTAHDPRFSARRCARVARAPRVHKRDSRTAFQQTKGSPSAENARANHGNVGFPSEWFGHEELEDTRVTTGRKAGQSWSHLILSALLVPLTASGAVPRIQTGALQGPK